MLAMLRRLAEEDPAASRRLMDLGAADFMRDLSGCVRRRPPRRPPTRPHRHVRANPPAMRGGSVGARVQNASRRVSLEGYSLPPR